MEALAPFIVENTKQDPAPFPYLTQKNNYNFDINLQVDIKCKYPRLPTFFPKVPIFLEFYTWARMNERYVKWKKIQTFIY